MRPYISARWRKEARRGETRDSTGQWYPAGMRVAHGFAGPLLSNSYPVDVRPFYASLMYM